jgi:hypothetical protein
MMVVHTLLCGASSFLSLRLALRFTGGKAI